MNENLMSYKLLSRYDDLFTDLFLDNLNLWFNTNKLNNEHRRPRVPNTKILDIIQGNILKNSRMMTAVDELLEMDYFKHYLSCKSPKQVQEFVHHMKRYLYMYMPDAGYEISDTTRYSERKVEACLIATKDWYAGEELEYLTGTIDSKRGILGPARFVNHDCDSNCRPIIYKPNCILLQAKRDIRCGDELTLYYGDHYFDENNSQCKCVTCEKQGAGYFSRKRRPTKDETISNKQKRQKVMSIDFICNEDPLLELLDLEKTIVVNSDLYSPPLSIKADSAVGMSPETEEKEKGDLLDQFLDDISDLSSVSSWSEETVQKKKKLKKENRLDCVACFRPLQTVPVGPDTSLIQELATWTWSPSAVFTDWYPKRCPRCERHFSIFKQEWPNRRAKLMTFSQLTTPSELTPSSEYAYSPLSEEIEL